MFRQPNLSGASRDEEFAPMDRPKHDLKGMGLHRDQIDVLCFKTGSLFAATLALALVLIAVLP